MNIKKYLEEKKDNISKNAKKAVATGLTVATILAGSSALTSCDENNIEDLPDVNYLDLMSMIDEDINNFNEGFEYAGFMIFSNNNNYVLSFVDEFATDNASYNITKEQFKTIKETALDLEVEEGIYQESEDVIVIVNDVLQLEQLDNVRKIISDVVQKQDPYRIKQQSFTDEMVTNPNY